MKISFYPSFGEKGKEVDLVEILNAIKDGTFASNVETLRSLKGEMYDDCKRRLPHFTVSGLFAESRRIDNLVQYNPLIILDIDHIGEEKAKKLRDGMFLLGHCLAAFLSPGGNGLKIIILADSTPETHGAVFNQVARFYEKFSGCDVDKSGKDISRCCFMSYDPEMYLNEEPVAFKADSKLISESEPVARAHAVRLLTLNDDGYPVISEGVDDKSLFREMIEFTENIDYYAEGNRNNFLYKLVNNLNKAGMDKECAERMICENYPEMSGEISRIVYNAYKNTDEHGIYIQDDTVSESFDGIAMPAIAQTGRNTPFIPDEVYHNLPAFLQKCTSVFKVPRERDVFLTGALTVLSGCFDNVTGIYDKMVYSPNLYSFIIAPPASGKGVLNHSRRLAGMIHENTIRDYDSSEKSDEKRMRTHYIPADSSSAAIKRVLKLNNGQGTICETEADTLSGTLAQDWGGFDDLLRKAFQHEPISCSRVDNVQEDFDDVKINEVTHPKLSICLSGTPSQVPALLKSTENGLFSRFMFYTYKNEGTPLFKDVFDDEGVPNLCDFFEGMAEEVYEMYIEVIKAKTVDFEMTKNQKKQFRKQFNETLKRMHETHGADTHGIVFRLGLVTFRIAMVLSILRSFEEKFREELVCSDEDFRTSLILSDIYLEHSMSVYQSLPGNYSGYRSNAMILFAHLPTGGFSYSDAVKIASEKCGFSSRSVSTYLKKLTEKGYLKQPKFNGLYYKV